MRLDRLDWLAFSLAAAIICFQLFVPPVIGLANNGDFGRIIGSLDLHAPFEDESKFAPTTYTIDPRWHWNPRFFSSEYLLARAALAVNKIVSKSQTFDIRCAGAVHAALYLLAWLLALPLFHGLPPVRRAILVGVGLFIPTDVMYVSALNSFYMDTAALMFLLLCVVFYLRALRWRNAADRAGLLLAFPLLLTSKISHALTACFLLVGILLTVRSLGAGWKWTAGFAAASLAALLAVRAGTPWDYAPVSVSNVIFYGLLPHSSDVHADLLELGLDDSYRQCINYNSFGTPQMSDPSFVKTFAARTGFGHIVLFYLHHPREAARIFLSSLNQAGRQRPPLGNFDKSTGAREYQQSNAFAFWSGLKRRLFTDRAMPYLCYILAVSGLLCAAAFRRTANLAASAIAIAAIAFTGMTWTELLVSSLGDVVEVTRHHFVFTAMSDMALLFALALLFTRPRTLTAAPDHDPFGTGVAALASSVPEAFAPPGAAPPGASTLNSASP